MSTISPGRLLDIEGVGDPVAVSQTNFEVLTAEISKFTPTFESGVATTVIGPPTIGARILNERWHDANNAEYICTVAGTPGTWRQVNPAVVAGAPSSGTIPTDYLIEDAADYNRVKRHQGNYTWVYVYEAYGADSSAVNEVFDTLGTMGAAGGLYWRNVDDIDCTVALTGVLIGNGSSGPEVIAGLTADRIARIGTSGQTLVNSIARDDGTYFSIGAAADVTQNTLQVTGGVSLIGASTIKTSIGALTLDAGNSLQIYFKIGGSNGWYIDSDSKLYVVGAGSIGSTTGAFTVFTGAANGAISLNPNGSGAVTIYRSTGTILTWTFSGSSATLTGNGASEIGTSSGDLALNPSGTITACGTLSVSTTKVGIGIAAGSAASLVEIQGGLTTTGAILTLGSKETTTVANDVLGRVNFYAPLDSAGTDAILVAASIVARSEGTFSASSNATSLLFQTGSSEVATTKWSITSTGVLQASAAQSITTTAGALTLAPATTVNLSGFSAKSVLFSGTSGAITEDTSFSYDTATKGFAVGAVAETTVAIFAYRTGAKTVTNQALQGSNEATSSTASINRTGVYASSTGVWNGAGAKAIGLYIAAISGGTENWAIYNNTAADVYLGTGNTLIGAAGTPTADLSFGGAATINTLAGALTLAPFAGSNLNVTTSGAGDFAVNTSQLYVDSSLGNVGIGTTAPSTLLHVGLAGTTQGTIGIAGVTSGLVTIKTVSAAGTWTLTLPAAVGTAGYQLTDAAGDGISTWAAAASKREYKDILSTITDGAQALKSILTTSIYSFKYKEGAGTGDRETVYTGLIADEAPWAMHFNGSILNPISTFGYTVLSIQALHKKIENLEARIKTLVTA